MSSEKTFPSKKNYERADQLASAGKIDLSFIKEYKIDEGLCDDLVEFFNKTPFTDTNPWYSKNLALWGKQVKSELNIKNQ